MADARLQGVDGATRVFSVLFGCAVGCAPNDSPLVPEPAASLEPRRDAVASAGSNSIPFDVSAVIRQVHFGFRAEGEALVGRHSSYEVRADPDGPFTVEPVSTAARRAHSLRFETVTVGRTHRPTRTPNGKTSVAED